jgi:hypothetical protein
MRRGDGAAVGAKRNVDDGAVLPVSTDGEVGISYQLKGSIPEVCDSNGCARAESRENPESMAWTYRDWRARSLRSSRETHATWRTAMTLVSVAIWIVGREQTWTGIAGTA